jgi:hypothetical protein
MPSSIIYHRDYYFLKKKKLQDYAKQYRLNNRDKLLEYGKNYYKNNTERCRSLNIAWKLKNIPGYRKTKKPKQPLTFNRVNQHVLVTFD